MTNRQTGLKTYENSLCSPTSKSDGNMPIIKKNKAINKLSITDWKIISCEVLLFVKRWIKSLNVNVKGYKKVPPSILNENNFNIFNEPISEKICKAR